jgi:hypothetical protein
VKLEYRQNRRIEDLAPVLIVTDGVFQALKRFVAAKPIFNVTPDQLDKSRRFAERQLRYNILSAAQAFGQSLLCQFKLQSNLSQFSTQPFGSRSSGASLILLQPLPVT